MFPKFSRIAEAIATVFWFWRHDSKSHMLVENQPVCVSFPEEGCVSVGMRLRRTKRVRIRSKPLTVDDVITGMYYVPKRGNDRTPNYRVVAVQYGGDRHPALVWFCRDNELDKMACHPTGTPVAEFLSLVARRVNDE